MTMKKLLITMTMLVGVLFGGLMTTAQAENLNYTVSADLPKNQLNSKVSYFDLKVTPGQTQDLTIQIKNSDNAAHKYVVTPNRATTNDNGVIDYSGMAFYSGTRFPQWKDSLFIGALKEKNLIRLSLNGNRVEGQERLLADRGERIRDVRTGPDGWLYVLTDEANGKLLKVGLQP